MKKRIVAVLGAGMLSVFIGTADAETALVSEYLVSLGSKFSNRCISC